MRCLGAALLLVAAALCATSCSVTGGSQVRSDGPSATPSASEEPVLDRKRFQKTMKLQKRARLTATVQKVRKTSYKFCFETGFDTYVAKVGRIVRDGEGAILTYYMGDGRCSFDPDDALVIARSTFNHAWKDEWIKGSEYMGDMRPIFTDGGDGR